MNAEEPRYASDRGRFDAFAPFVDRIDDEKVRTVDGPTECPLNLSAEIASPKIARNFHHGPSDAPDAVFALHSAVASLVAHPV